MPTPSSRLTGVTPCCLIVKPTSTDCPGAGVGVGVERADRPATGRGGRAEADDGDQRDDQAGDEPTDRARPGSWMGWMSVVQVHAPPTPPPADRFHRARHSGDVGVTDIGSP